jgi:hypothetical protein
MNLMYDALHPKFDHVWETIYYLEGVRSVAKVMAASSLGSIKVEAAGGEQNKGEGILGRVKGSIPKDSSSF